MNPEPAPVGRFGVLLTAWSYLPIVDQQHRETLDGS
jgi:hypothetical protein